MKLEQNALGGFLFPATVPFPKDSKLGSQNCKKDRIRNDKQIRNQILFGLKRLEK